VVCREDLARGLPQADGEPRERNELTNDVTQLPRAPSYPACIARERGSRVGNVRAESFAKAVGQ
jgi:hypothetical protein